MILRPPRSTQSRSSAASDVYKRQELLVQRRRAPVAMMLNAIPLARKVSCDVILYVPGGIRSTLPLPAAIHALKAFCIDAVSSLTPLPFAPYAFT